MPRIDVSSWSEFRDRNTSDLNVDEILYDLGFCDAMNLVNGWLKGREKATYTNRDWLNSLSPVELVNWIKNTAAAMSHAELLRWMEEKHNG